MGSDEMRRGCDLAMRFPGLYVVHHNIPGKRARGYRVPEHLLFFPLHGELLVRAGSLSLSAGPGKMIYLPPETKHSMDSSDVHGERLICLIDGTEWDRSGAAVGGPRLLPASQLGKEILFYLLLHPQTKNADSLVTVFVQVVAEALEGSRALLEPDHLESRTKDERLEKALSFFRSRLGGQVSMRDAAEAAGLGVRTLNRLFLSQLGLTPKQVLTHYRVAKARDLLLSGKVSATQAALEVGYSSFSRFIAVFRQLTGQLPSEVARFGLGRGPDEGIAFGHHSGVDD